MKTKIAVFITGFLLIFAAVSSGAGNLITSGDATIGGDIGIGGGVSAAGARLLLTKTDGSGPVFALANNFGETWFATFFPNQWNRFSTIPGGALNYWLFEQSVEGRNKEVRIYGYPTGAAGLDYGAFQVTGTAPDFQISTANTLILNPGSGVAIGATGAGGYQLWVEGEAWSTAGWSSTSDRRYKKNIETIESALDTVLRLKGVSYEWEIDKYGDKGFTKGKHYGVVAQEIAKVLPEVVRKNTTGDLGVSYMEMIPVLIEAVKEQQKMIDMQKQELGRQQKEIEELKSKM